MEWGFFFVVVFREVFSLYFILISKAGCYDILLSGAFMAFYVYVAFFIYNRILHQRYPMHFLNHLLHGFIKKRSKKTEIIF